MRTVVRDKKIKPGAVNQKELEKIEDQIDTSNIFYFRRHGQSVAGLLYPPRGRNQHQQAVYPIDQVPGDPESTVLIPGNKHIRKLVKKFKLIGKHIKLVYVGDKFTRAGHKEKVFAAYVIGRSNEKEGRAVYGN